MKLIGLYGEKFRHPVNLSEVPPKLQLAYIAIQTNASITTLVLTPSALLGLQPISSALDAGLKVPYHKHAVTETFPQQ